MQRCLLILILLVLALPAFAQANPDAVTGESLVSQHLDSIATAAERAAAQSRGAEGTVDFDMTQGGTTKMGGRAALATANGMLRVAFQFPTKDYPGEEFICDGSKVSVGTTTVSSRSELGDFLHRNPEILREGLFGGTLSTAWPLHNLAKRKAKVKYLGLRKLDGEALHAASYEPKKGTDFTVRLYFEPQTFRHVATVYEMTLPPPMRRMQTAQLEDTRYKLVERFTAFETADGITLPRQWTLRYSVSPAFAREVQWLVRWPRLSNTAKYPAEAFAAQSR